MNKRELKHRIRILDMQNKMLRDELASHRIDWLQLVKLCAEYVQEIARLKERIAELEQDK